MSPKLLPVCCTGLSGGNRERQVVASGGGGAAAAAANRQRKVLFGGAKSSTTEVSSGSQGKATPASINQQTSINMNRQAVGEGAIIPSSFLGRISARTSLISTRDFKMNIQLLDDNETICQEFKKTANAQIMLDYVCECLNIVEKDYFGLRYQDFSKHRVSSHHEGGKKYWMDMNKPISKQVRGPNVGLRFRVRFYPSDVTVVKEEITRYMLFSQLQRDLLHGRLYCPQNEAAILGALTLQSVIGDYDAESRPSDYVAQYKLLLKQTEKLEDKVAEAHKQFKGLTAAEAELEFLKRASTLDTYGFDPYTVMDKQKQTMYIGVTHRGIFIYHISRMIHHITWDQLDKVDYSGKELMVIPASTYVSPYTTDQFDGNSTIKSTESICSKNGLVKSPKSKNTLKFLCPSAVFAKHLWRHILSQQAFFNENDAKHIKPKFSKPRIPLLTRGSTFHFPISRVQHEIESEGCGKRNGPEPEVARYPLQRQPPRNNVYTSTGKYNTFPRPGRVDEAIIEDEPVDEAKEIDDPTGDEAAIANLSSHLVDAENVCEASKNDDCIVDDEISLPEMVPVTTAQSSDLTDTAVPNLIRYDAVKPTSDRRIAVASRASSSTSLIAKFAKLFFSLLLLLLLLTAVAIALFERDSPWLRSAPVLDPIRHSVYEPLRHHILALYARLGPH